MPGHIQVVDFDSGEEAGASADTSVLELFAREEGPLLRFAMGIAGDRMIAEEVVQESFVRLHERDGSIAQPRAWLYRCVKNLCLNHHRKAWREESYEEGVAEAVGDAKSEPDQALDRREQLAVLRCGLAGLPEQDLELVRRKYFERETYEEIGKATGMKSGTVGYRLHSALKQLAETLRQTGHEHWNWEGANK